MWDRDKLLKRAASGKPPVAKAQHPEASVATKEQPEPHPEVPAKETPALSFKEKKDNQSSMIAFCIRSGV
jgi:hypothetical protein